MDCRELGREVVVVSLGPKEGRAGGLEFVGWDEENETGTGIRLGVVRTGERGAAKLAVVGAGARLGEPAWDMRREARLRGRLDGMPFSREDGALMRRPAEAAV